MCGRYAVTSDTPSMYGLFSLPEPDDDDELTIVEAISPRYNIAPTTDVPVILERMGMSEALAKSEAKSEAKSDTAPESVRQLSMMRWGLVPSWAKDPAIGNRMFNARADSVADKPAFRRAFERRRCLIPANGYYEWQKVGVPGRAPKQPYYITPLDASMMAFAGLWEFWRSPSGEPLRSCTIITTEGVGELAQIHHRMPLILPAVDWDHWLNPHADPADLTALIGAPDDRLVQQLEIRAVSNRVGNVRNDDPSLVEPVDQQATSGTEEPPGLFPI